MTEFHSPREQLEQKMVEQAIALLETPYLYGGKSALGIDCSGYAESVWKAADAWPFMGDAAMADIWRNAPRVEFEDRRPGDVICFWTDPADKHAAHHGVVVMSWNVIAGANSGGPPHAGENHEAYAARMKAAGARVKMAGSDYWESNRLGVVRAPKLYALSMKET